MDTQNIENNENIIYIESLSDFLDEINKIGKEEKGENKIKENTLFYRGHSNEVYELEPSIYRKNKEGEFLYIENEDKIYRETIAKVPYDFKGKNTIENKAWTIGVENPIKPLDEKELITTIQFENQGLATSGNYRKVWTDSNGRKYVHSINPITGRATQSDVLSATVVAPSTMYADGYATMFMVMGMEKSKAFLAKHPDLAVLLVYSNDKNEELTFKTNPFKKLEEKN